MHVAFGRVRRKSLIFAEDADYADFKRFGHHGFVIKGVASFLSEDIKDFEIILAEEAFLF